MEQQEKGQKTLVPLKPYTFRELAKLYTVDWRTFKKWVEPFQAEIGERRGRYFTIPQVKIIFEKMGLPSMIEVD